MPKIALGQMLVEWNHRNANLERAVAYVRHAKALGADILVLPECLDLGWLSDEAARMAEPIPGPVSRTLATAAREEGVYLVAGLTERSGNKVYNTAILIDPLGTIILRHRKINELPEGLALYSCGRAVEVAETPWGPAGIPICADNFGGSLALGSAMAVMGARLLLSPCAWAVGPEDRSTQQQYLAFWLKSYRMLAQRHRLSIIAVSNVGWIRGGPWNGYRCIGSSVVVGPDGEVLRCAGYGVDAEEVMVVDVP